MKKTSILLIAAAVALVTGCATVDLQGRTPSEHVALRRDEAVRDFVNHPAEPSVRELNTPYLDLRPVPVKRAKGPLSLRAANTEFGPLLTEVARANGYTVLFADSVDTRKRITVELNGADVVEGMKSIAFLAGYIAIVRPEDQTVIVSDTATFTYKLPPHVLEQLQASYKVGGNPVNNDTGGGSGGSSGSNDMSAEFIVSGQSVVNAASLRVLITSLAGRNAEVMVSDMGLISVRANAQAQQRVHNFLRTFVRDAMSQVEIEASIVEVSLTDQFELGIDWGRVLGKSTILGSVGQLAVDIASPVSDMTPSLSAAFTTDSNISAVVNALRQVTDAKVVSNPRILAVNNSPATFFDGTQLPYLGTVTATGGSLETAPQVSGSASYAVDGISFSVQPSIIDENRVQITLVPVLSSVLEFKQFSLGDGGGMIIAPQQTNKQSFMKVIAESGKTLILGGIRYSVDQKSETPMLSFLGSRSRTKSAKEIVILMRATVLPAQEYDPLIGESI